MSRTAYILLRDRFEHKAGTTVYECAQHDYGLARDDTNHTGVLHVSMTLDPNGEYPFFTVPEHHLREVP